jgi:ferric-dicitrate binding protein FerR (iron transport regulator)
VSDNNPHITTDFPSDLPEFIQRMDGWERENLNAEESADPVIGGLFAYRQERSEQLIMDDDVSTAMWNEISKQTQRSDQKKDNKEARVFTLSSGMMRWSAAAVIIIAISVFGWIFTQPESAIVAETQGQKMEFVLDDGTKITMRPWSQLELISESEQNIQYRLDGEAYFDVQKRTEQNWNLDTESGTVSVLGTSFNVSTWGEETRVFLEEGRVRLTSTETNQADELEPGEKAEIGGDLKNWSITSTDGQAATDWMREELLFEETPMRDVAAELEQHYNIRIQLSESIKQEQVSGRLLLDSRDQILNDLELILGGTFQKNGEASYSYKPK